MAIEDYRAQCVSVWVCVCVRRLDLATLQRLSELPGACALTRHLNELLYLKNGIKYFGNETAPVPSPAVSNQRQVSRVLVTLIYSCAINQSTVYAGNADANSSESTNQRIDRHK